MRAKAVTAHATVLALGMTAACGGGSGVGDAAALHAARSRSGCRTTPRRSPGARRWSRRGTPTHPDEKVTAQEIPAGKTSEEVIGAAITAGNAPCLVFNTSPAAVPQFQKQGGLVALDAFDGAHRLHRGAHAATSAEQYKSPDGQYYQIPWKSNPVMIFYNKEIFEKAGIDPENPPLGTYDEFLDDQPQDRRQRGRAGRDLARADQRVLPVLVRLLPAVRRRDRRHSSSSRTARHVRLRGGPDGRRLLVARCTPRACRRRRPTTATRSPTRRPRWRSSARGRSRSTATRSTGAWSRCRPRTGTAAERDLHLLRRQERRPLLRLREPEDRVGRARSSPPARSRTASCWRRPARCRCAADLPSTYPEYFEKNPEYKTFADQAVAHRRGAERAELDRDLAGVPRRVLRVRDLRQEPVDEALTAAADEGRRARRPVLTG